MTDADAKLDVSRETMERLRAFADLVLKWTPKINLISKNTHADMWGRHILDSAQLAPYAEGCNHWVDIGAGGGFPGVVVTCIAKATSPQTRFTLIESDQRKAAFLRTAIRELELNASVLAERIELTPPQFADVLSARALTDLTCLIGHAERHLAPSGMAVFQKGANWEKELEDAQRHWNFQFEAVTSQTQQAAVILKIEGVSRA